MTIFLGGSAPRKISRLLVPVAALALAPKKRTRPVQEAQ